MGAPGCSLQILRLAPRGLRLVVSSFKLCKHPPVLTGNRYKYRLLVFLPLGRGRLSLLYSSRAVSCVMCQPPSSSPLWFCLSPSGTFPRFGRGLWRACCVCCVLTAHPDLEMKCFVPSFNSSCPGAPVACYPFRMLVLVDNRLGWLRVRDQSVCSSVNEIACHAIPDDRPLEDGDLVSFDVSVFLNVSRQTDIHTFLACCIYREQKSVAPVV